MLSTWLLINSGSLNTWTNSTFSLISILNISLVVRSQISSLFLPFTHSCSTYYLPVSNALPCMSLYHNCWTERADSSSIAPFLSPSTLGIHFFFSLHKSLRSIFQLLLFSIDLLFLVLHWFLHHDPLTLFSFSSRNSCISCSPFILTISCNMSFITIQSIMPAPCYILNSIFIAPLHCSIRCLNSTDIFKTAIPFDQQ